MLWQRLENIWRLYIDYIYSSHQHNNTETRPEKNMYNSMMIIIKLSKLVSAIPKLESSFTAVTGSSICSFINTN